MPIPETPYTRKEAYLNAIATGDSGGIPETPYTREEMYLDAIARGGGGGGGGGGGSSTLSGLTDVDISNPTDGQTLVYNATSGKWENGAGGSSSGVRFFEAIYGNDDSLTLSVTAETLYEAMQSSVCVVKSTDGGLSLVLWDAGLWREAYTFNAFHYAAVRLAATDMVILEFVSD